MNTQKTRKGVIRVRAEKSVTAAPQTSEKYFEKRLRDELAKAGIPCLKYFNPHETGYPDRIVLLPGGHVVWVELKSTGMAPTRMQLYRHAELRRQGHSVDVVSTSEELEAFVERCITLKKQIESYAL